MLSIIFLLPLVLAILIVTGRTRRAAIQLAPWASALLLWPVFYHVGATLNWPLDGMVLGVDEAIRPFLLLTAIAWTLAGLMARSIIETRLTLFWLGWLSSLTGMSLVLLAGDLITFYLGYAVLSLSSFLLIIHQGSHQAWRAGSIYLILTITAEAAVLTGILLIAGRYGNMELAQLVTIEHPGVHTAAGWLLLAGFAVKLGIMPVHVWLPLAHPVAPVPASAVLSGVIVKAGLIGWLRLVPSDSVAVAGAATALIVLGFITAFGGIGLGLCQQRIKTVLAYSTISQMGLVLAGFALAFQMPEERTAIVTMLGVFALHHGLNKTALFMACGCAPGLSRWRMLLVALPALSLAAAPMTSGFLAKELFKESLYAAGLASAVVPILALTSTGTALLMWRVFQLARAEREAGVPADPAWVVMTIFALMVPWAWVSAHVPVSVLMAGKLWAATWPLLLAGGLIVTWARFVHIPLQLPEGDWVVGAERLFYKIRVRLSIPSTSLPRSRWSRIVMRRTRRFSESLENQLGWLPFAGLLMLLITAALWWQLSHPVP